MNLYDNLPDDKLDEAIAGLDEKIARRAQINRMLPDLERERDRLEALEAERRQNLASEQADVEALRRKSPLVLWLSLTDKLEARMDKEEREALEAEALWQSAHDELEAVTQHIRRLKGEYRSFGLCEEHRNELMARKKALVLRENAEKADELAALEQKITALEAQRREVTEAIDVGNRMVLLCTEALPVLSSLSEAYHHNRIGTHYVYSTSADDLEKERRNADSYIESIHILMPELKSELNDLRDMDLPEIRQEGPDPMSPPLLRLPLLDESSRSTVSRRGLDIQALSHEVKAVLAYLEPVRSSLDSQIRTLKHQADAVIRKE